MLAQLDEQYIQFYYCIPHGSEENEYGFSFLNTNHVHL